MAADPASVSAAPDRLRDPARLRALAATGLSPTVHAPTLDRLTALAARLLHAPIALVSLVEADRQFFAGVTGLGGERETPLARSFCRHVVTDDAALIVADAREDDRLRDNPAVADGILAYVGTPLRTPAGHVLGSFCVADTTPRSWNDTDLATLTDLAAAVEADIALRLANGRLQQVLDTALDAFVAIDDRGTVTAWNIAAEQMFGWSSAEALGQELATLIVPEGLRDAHRAGLARARERGRLTLAGQRIELSAVDSSGREFPVEVTLQLDDQHFHAFVRDITDRVADRTALEHERQRQADERTFLQALLDSLDTGVVACDSDGQLALFNQALLRMHGTSLQPLDVETWAQTYDLHGPDGRTPLTPQENPLTRAFAGHLIDGQEMVITAPGVAARRFLANGRPIDTPDGRRLGALVALHDITDTHRAEILRRAQDAVPQALADATSAREAAQAAINAVAAVLGWSCADYRDLDDEAPGQDHPRGDDDPLVAAVRERQEPVVEHTGSTSADEPPVRLGLPVGVGDTISGVIIFCPDAADEPHPDTAAMLDGVCTRIGRYLERRRAEDLALALAAAQRDFERVAAQIDDYLWTLEVLPDGRTRSIYASPNADSIFGGELPSDADVATALGDRVHPDDADAFAHFQATVNAGDTAEVECRIRGVDRQTRWIWTRAVPRREDGRLLVDGISTDVTERRHVAEQRERLLTAEQQQVVRLRELDRMKDELVAVVSHELRNPIGTIRGYTELLLDDPDLSAEHRTHAAVIDRTSTHLKHLVDQLLDLARIDAGHIRLDARPLSLVRLVQDTVADHRPTANTKDITIVTELAATLPTHGDATRLRQVFDNLLSNAIKYTPDGGTVTVRGTTEQGAVEVTVTDTGIGVPAEQLPQLFTRFFRASTALDRGIKGTGLGLAVSKAIVEAHLGTIGAEPAEPQGTRFRIRLPAGARPIDS